MANKIITISREFGSGGRYIGAKLAERLGIAFYDKDIITKVAEKSGFSEKFVEEKGEYAPTKNVFAYAFVGRDTTGKSVTDYLYEVQRNIILDLADKESFVIVGRCADYILRDRENVYNIFIHGNKPEKVDRIMRLYDKSERDALVMMRDMDKKRRVHYEYYTDSKWGAARNYALTLNSSTLGYDKCLDILAHL